MVTIKCDGCGERHAINTGVRYYGKGALLVLIRCHCGEYHELSRSGEGELWQPPKLTPLDAETVKHLFQEPQACKSKSL